MAKSFFVCVFQNMYILKTTIIVPQLDGESVAYPHCAAGDARTAAAGGAVLLGADSISPS